MNDTPVEIKPLTEVEGRSLTDMFETDPAAEETGRWFDKFMGEQSDLDIKLRGFSSHAAVAVTRRMQALYSRLMTPDGSYPIDIQIKIICQQLAEGIIVDWRGKDWRMDNAALVYSPANALAVVTRFKPIRARIMTLSGNFDSFRVLEQEAVIKN